ncbi:hypothetical protein ACFW04_013398 [Cataglyphis niger]
MVRNATQNALFCLSFIVFDIRRAETRKLIASQITPEVLPEFLAPLENHTVIQGRDVFFTCVVNHLQSYKVAWIKSDSRAILAIHTHLVAHNNRLSVTHNGHNTWKLHVSNVQKNDSGTYMCQVNTDPMRSQMGYMEVVVPPDIIDDETANGMVTHEGGNIRLRCVATGVPEPTVSWKREDGRNIILREDGQKQSVKSFSGETLELTGVLRQEMGMYLCIASNTVPPTVSKRYSVDVHYQCSSNIILLPSAFKIAKQCLLVYSKDRPKNLSITFSWEIQSNYREYAHTFAMLRRAYRKNKKSPCNLANGIRK